MHHGSDRGKEEYLEPISFEKYKASKEGREIVNFESARSKLGDFIYNPKVQLAAIVVIGAVAALSAVHFYLGNELSNLASKSTDIGAMAEYSTRAQLAYIRGVALATGAAISLAAFGFAVNYRAISR